MTKTNRFNRRREMSGPACACIALGSVLAMLLTVIGCNLYFGLPLY